jgi:transposase-like protein
MKKVPNRHYSKESREEAVKLATEKGFSAYEASSRLGLPESTIENWVRAEKNVIYAEKDLP